MPQLKSSACGSLPAHAGSDWAASCEKLEACALAGGARVAHIETGAVLTEALALYRSAGWFEVPAFNQEPFADHWLEKALI